MKNDTMCLNDDSTPNLEICWESVRKRLRVLVRHFLSVVGKDGLKSKLEMGEKGPKKLETIAQKM